MYPEYITVNGHEYKINTDYRVALACFKAINDETISDIERFYAVLCLLLGTDVLEEDEEIAYQKCGIYLRCGKEQNQTVSEIDMDYEQDSGYINTSFRSCYHMDIKNENMHWWEYNEMIEGFGEQEILNRVRYIRSRKLSEVKDEKERQALIKQKQAVALKTKEQPKTKEQEEIDDIFNKL